MKLKYFLFLFLTLTIIHQTSSIATVRYVSKTGTSTPPYTSWQTASDSIQKCINICVTGDTIYVANGVYKENLLISTAISLIGSSMDSTVIDGTGLTTITIHIIPSGVGGTIENFKILGKGFNLGAVILTEKSLLIKNCRLLNDQRGISIINNSVTTENIFISNVSNGYYASCITDTCHTYISNSLITLSQSSAQGIRAGIGGELFIRNNNILFLGTNNSESGISIGAPRKVFINNNLISGFRDDIFFDTVVDTAFIKNNLIVFQNSGGATAGIVSSANKIFVDNSILANNIRGIYQTGGGFVRSNYNIYWDNENDLTGLAYGDSDIVSDPMFVNDTIPTANGSYDFHLQAFSPSIDKGNPSILDVDGSRSDIGLYGGPLGESYTYQDLAPKPPRNLTATMDSGLVHLKWNKNTEADLFLYRVYRDTVPEFIYDTTKIIAVLSDTTFYDDPPQKFISGNYYYKITAIDSAYHQSPASEEAHINITGIPEAPPIVVEHYNLLQNYPNPFNPSTTIPYRLKAPGYVKVMVYNLLGEQVKVLVNKYQSAGYYEVQFHPTSTERKSAEGKIEFETGYGDIVSGIYLYRIEVIGEGNIPVFTDMKKMLMIK